MEERVARAADLRDGELREVEVDGKKCLLLACDGALRAFGARCTHYDGPLAKGLLHDGRLVCPWHQGTFDARTGDLPGGWRQRLALACAILHEPQLLFLDEPTAGVDPVSRRSFWQLVRTLVRQGTTVLVTTHYMDEAEYCDRVGLMVDGRLAALDTPAALKARFVPGRMFDVHGPAAGSRDRLAAVPGLVHAEPFGAGFHVRVADAAVDAEELARRLGAAGFPGAAVDDLEPSLEDVFLEVVEGSREPVAAPEVAA
jgi:ABC-2 type transport system ATP-binding protein